LSERNAAANISRRELLLMSAVFYYGPFVEPTALAAEYNFNNCSFIITATPGCLFNKAMSRALLAISSALANWPSSA
jgi:hypothetical protein